MNNFDKLRPYQIEDAKFLSGFQQGGCFNEQRTGKTPTNLYTFHLQGITKTLIVCPASMLEVWKEEYEYWTGNPCIVLNKTRSKNLKLLDEWTHGLVVSYDTLKETKAKDGYSNEIMALKPEGVILDEAHRIKGRTTAAAKAAKNIQKIPFRLALTGTPAPNKPYDIWPILNWLYPREFTSYWDFLAYYFRQVRLATYTDIRGFKPGKANELQKLLDSRCTQRKRKEVMPWLPQKDYLQIHLEATSQQKKYLKELNDYFETEHINTQGVLDRLTRYRQICLDPGILDLEGASPKTNWIIQYLKDYPDKPVLIFAKSRKYLERLSEKIQFKPHILYTGGLTAERKQELIQQFHNN